MKKEYLEIKKSLLVSLLNENKSIKEKIEEELALRASEQQIIDEICPNPVEEGLGNKCK